MIKASLPATANIFLLDFLSIVRLHVGMLDELIVNSLTPESNQVDFAAIRSQDVSFYNELVNSCGYHVSLVRNLALVFFLFALIVTIWFFVACKDSFVTCSAYCCRAKANRRHEVWWNNFFIRFLYEVFFEITICLMLSFSVIKIDEGQGLKVWTWFLTIGLTLAAVAILTLLSFLCSRNGPYVRDSFEKKSLAKSFWHYRSIRPELMELHKD